MTCWVGQEDPFGCNIAVCAMLLGCSYEDAAALYPGEASEERGYTWIVLDNILVERGFAIARKCRHDASKRVDRAIWPPEPWADVHWMDVEVPAGFHSVVLLRDGTVLDPAQPGRWTLTDYPKVVMVTAIHRVA